MRFVNFFEYYKMSQYVALKVLVPNALISELIILNLFIDVYLFMFAGQISRNL